MLLLVCRKRCASFKRLYRVRSGRCLLMYSCLSALQSDGIIHCHYVSHICDTTTYMGYMGGGTLSNNWSAIKLPGHVPYIIDKPLALGASRPPVTIDIIFISTNTIITVVILIAGLKINFGPLPCGKAQHIKNSN